MCWLVCGAGGVLSFFSIDGVVMEWYWCCRAGWVWWLGIGLVWYWMVEESVVWCGVVWFDVVWCDELVF